MTGFIAFLFVVFLILSGKYIVIGLFMLIFRILLTIYSIIAEILAAIFIPSKPFWLYLERGEAPDLQTELNQLNIK